MKRTLSFLKPVNDGLNWAGQGVLAMWRIGRFDYFPTEKNLLLSYWYDFRHFKRVAPGRTMYDFLDSRVVYIKRQLEKTDLSSKKRQMYRDFLGALRQPKLRDRIIKFFESPNPEEHCKPLIDMIKAAWRMGEEVKAPSIAGSTEPVASSAPMAHPDTQKADVVRPDEKPALDAKTYVVAAEIHFELMGKTADYL